MFQLFIAFAGIIIGTLTDIKKREVPDWVNFSLIGAGLGISLMYSIHLSNYWILLFSFTGLGAGYVLGAAMYYTGQWGGGDAKMIMGIGALTGLPFLPSWWGQTPFFVLFLLFSVFAGAAYGVAWMIVLFVKHRKKVTAHLSKKLRTKKMLRTRIAVIISAIIIALVGVFMPGPLTFMFVLLAALLYITFYFSLAVKAVEETCFIQQRAVGDLVEGDWMIEDVKKGKKILVEATSSGITKEQLSLLKKHNIKEVTIKEGIPFVPSFLIAFIAAWYVFHNEIPLLFWM